jgi:hypothetical protein
LKGLTVLSELKHGKVADSINQVALKPCECAGKSQHDEFSKEVYLFPDGSKENLPVFCIENELYPDELYNQFRPILKTLESDENWTMYTIFEGLVAEVRPGLYFYRFSDVDEIGECNFYIKCDLKTVIYVLLREWGQFKSQWQTLLQNVGSHGYPNGYDPGTMVNVSEFLSNTDEKTLTFGFSYDMEYGELHQVMRELDL